LKDLKKSSSSGLPPDPRIRGETKRLPLVKVRRGVAMFDAEVLDLATAGDADDGFIVIIRCFFPGRTGSMFDVIIQFSVA
jgi:hypothetical protein